LRVEKNINICWKRGPWKYWVSRERSQRRIL